MKKNLKFINPEADNLGAVFGISEDRQQWLAAKLDNMVRMWAGPPVKVYMATVLEIIEEFCETQEEFIWCITNHITWAAINGRLIPPQ